ncbi:MAG: AMP-binding protein [Pseudomonadota bacterium]
MQDCNLARPVLERARTLPGRTALEVDGRTLSYDELIRETLRVVGWLETVPRTTRRIGLLASRTVEVYAGILACAWTGACFVPMSPRHPPVYLRHLLEHLHLDALIVDRSGLDLLRKGLAQHAPGSVYEPFHSGSDAVQTPSAVPPVVVSPDDVAYIMFTSGTTGSPKGVVITAGNVTHFLRRTLERLPIRPEDRLSQFFETTFDGVIRDLFSAWWSGASLHVLPEDQLIAPADFIRSRRLTVWFSVPSVITFLRRLNLLSPGTFPSLRYSLFGGESLSVSNAVAWKEAAPNSVLENLYGPTELTVATTADRVGDPMNVTEGRGTVSIGRPLPGMEGAVFDETGRLARRGETGELAFSGPQVAAGYLDDPSATADQFRTIHHPGLGMGIWYFTGDLAYEDENGFLHLRGRIDNQIKIWGQRIELEEVERRVQEVAPEAEIVCVPYPVQDGVVHGIVAFVSGNCPPPAEMLERIRETAPPYLVPKRFVPVDSIPRTPHGKTDRAALVRKLEKGQKG